ncbi:MAG: hypothetical protein ACO1OB_14075 [Archangium sp.]
MLLASRGRRLKTLGDTAFADEAFKRALKVDPLGVIARRAIETWPPLQLSASP